MNVKKIDKFINVPNCKIPKISKISKFLKIDNFFNVSNHKIPKISKIIQFRKFVKLSKFQKLRI